MHINWIFRKYLIVNKFTPANWTESELSPELNDVQKALLVNEGK